MNNKIAKTLGLASVLGASTAMGATTIGSSTAPLLTIGTQTLNTGLVVIGAGTNFGKTWYDLIDNTLASLNARPVLAGALDMSVTPGFATTTTGTYYMRVDYTNAVFKTAIVGAAFGINATTANTRSVTTASVQSGGATGSSSVVFLMTQATRSQTTTDKVIIPLLNIGVLGTASVSAKVSFYTTAAQAANALVGTDLATKTQTMVAFTNAQTPTLTKTNVEANVVGAFKNYTIKNATNNASTTDASFGAITHPVSTSFAMDADGTRITAGDAYLASSSILTLTGDLSAGTWFMDTTAACPLAGPTGTTAIAAAQKLTLNTAKTAGTITGTVFDASSFICNVIDTTSAIPAGAYTVGIVYGAAAAGDLVLTYAGGSAGSISRNGTSNNINYLTTFTGYNQKVILTNRSTIDGTYAFTFQTEADTTAVAGTKATGTLKAGTTTVIKATDLVTLTGKSRAAATFTAVLAPASVGVATTQVNLSDGATDTVTYRN